MTAIYESLLLKLVTVLELTQQSESTPTTQTRQALVQATTDFRESLKQAKELASTLPGGELSVDEQEDVIEMLFRLRDRKQQQLAEFAANVQSMFAATAAEGVMMDVDSTASTPS
ncbi:hypothetical protein IEO21_03378 [Rhodonia placenta]|uniref:Mediator of RNA polymerase II transcription subunit 9 n=2 Tax=Rhodonia placenta TaxID=104341 RepID=A0A1X6NGX8_9APHY|nr:hypothetical protein POSPLADRAFT_1051979 [Postia placenta MAD-698-R-SB12]KAF9817527.1 hypothetical protein IEO21_03378 [Postia placenta]OSX67864.1 hypothetical protein POSPLADRAFT_1051979 [Postia placenta MAD-698-R-SB12]